MSEKSKAKRYISKQKTLVGGYIAEAEKQKSCGNTGAEKISVENALYCIGNFLHLLTQRDRKKMEETDKYLNAWLHALEERESKA